MTDQTRDLLPEGLEDRLPQSAAAAARIERAAIEAMDAWGYDRVRPPLVEFEKSMAARMTGFATRQMFRFVDPKSLRMLALRSDMTVQVGRIAATSLSGRARPLRLCYAGQVARIAGDQLDPRREALQLGADLPFACKGGVCATCRAKLLAGEVIMDNNYALEPEEIKNGYILTCQSHPRSETILIDFDQK